MLFHVFLEYNFIRTFDIYSKLFDYYISLDMGVYPYIFVRGLILKTKTNKKVDIQKCQLEDSFIISC